MAVLAQILPALLFGVAGRRRRGPARPAADRGGREPRPRRGAGRCSRAPSSPGTVSIVAVLGALFVLGIAETFADVGSSSLLPRLVRREDLGIANARLQGAFLLTNQLLMPPIGAFLFAVGMALPFATNAACFALGALLVSRIVLRPRDAARRREPAPRAVQHAGGHGRGPPLARSPTRRCGPSPSRSSLFNVTFGAAWSVLVLYAQERLGMSAVGFGLLTTAMAIGGIIGTASYGRLERRFSLGDIMRVGLLIETATHLVLALTTSRGGRAGHLRRVRGARLRVGHDVDRRPPARRARRAAGAGDRRVHGGRLRRDRRRHADRRAARPELRDHGAVLVRVRRFGGAGHRPVAPVRQHRPRGRRATDVHARSPREVPAPEP